MVRNAEYLTVREAADWLRVSKATIRRLIDAGKMPALRVGRSIRIARTELGCKSGKGGVR